MENMSVETAYRKSIETVINWIRDQVNLVYQRHLVYNDQNECKKLKRRLKRVEPLEFLE